MILGLPAAEVSRYARDGVVEELGPDRCRLTLGAWSWAGLAATVGLFDADIEVVGPPELKAAFALLGRRYTAAAAPPPTAAAAPALYGGPAAPRNSLDNPPAADER
ncbi:WYL domain-containing protein [Streptomyces hirsutus]